MLCCLTAFIIGQCVLLLTAVRDFAPRLLAPVAVWQQLAGYKRHLYKGLLLLLLFEIGLVSGPLLAGRQTAEMNGIEHGVTVLISMCRSASWHETVY